MATARRLPGGYGVPRGQDAYLRRGESQYLRKALIPKEGGWLLSTVGENYCVQMDVTGSQLANNTLKLYYLPERAQTISVYVARLNVATAVAATTIETALFTYISADRRFVRIPNTTASFDSTSTGRKSFTLPATVDIMSDIRLFMGVAAHGGTPTVEGFQSGAGATPRVVLNRTVSSVSAIATSYVLGETAAETTNTDIPMIAYLSQDANLVI